MAAHAGRICGIAVWRFKETSIFFKEILKRIESWIGWSSNWKTDVSIFFALLITVEMVDICKNQNKVEVNVCPFFSQLFWSTKNALQLFSFRMSKKTYFQCTYLLFTYICWIVKSRKSWFVSNLRISKGIVKSFFVFFFFNGCQLPTLNFSGTISNL